MNRIFHLFFETTFNSNVSNTLNKYLDALVGSYSVYSLNIFCFVIYYIILYNIFCFVIKRSFNENKNYSLLCLSKKSFAQIKTDVRNFRFLYSVIFSTLSFSLTSFWLYNQTHSNFHSAEGPKVFLKISQNSHENICASVENKNRRSKKGVKSV